MNTCFSTSLKDLFLQPFSKCRFTFCLVCGCYFRNVSCVCVCVRGGHPWLIPHACALTTHIHAENTHTHAHHPALNHSPQELSVFIFGEPRVLVCCSLSSFNIQYNLPFLHLPWLERKHFLRGPFSSSFWPFPEYSPLGTKEKRCGEGGEKKRKTHLFKLVQEQEIHKTP